MKNLFLFFFLFIAIASALSAGAQRTTRTALKANTVATANVETGIDTIAPPEPHAVDINGYDKPLRSTRETFFATNNGRKNIAGIAFTISYFDTAERLLHKTHHNVNTDIPAGETRQIAIRSWDKQQAFYYNRSTVPVRAAQATPYDVKIEIDTLFVK